MIDRSDAVNLARNMLSAEDFGSLRASERGLRCLVDAVLAMDEYIRSHEAEQPEVAGLKLALEHIEATKRVWTDDTHIPPQALIHMIEASLQALLVRRQSRSTAPLERK